MDACGGLLPIVKVIVAAMKVVVIIIPIALIVYGTIDLGKAVIASDEKEVKAAQKRLIQRFIYAVLVFFVPTLVYFAMNLIASSDSDADATSWKACWKTANGN
ncbi:MAG: hypothetical protein IKE63_02545 [Bacilli bacterium]|jgi:hypothetical protein|nr:hypothetical protein [Bacilli bacterium]